MRSVSYTVLILPSLFAWATAASAQEFSSAQTVLTFTGTNSVQDVELTDMDGDGDLDIVAVQSGGRVGIAINDGTGAFDTAQLFTTPSEGRAVTATYWNDDDLIDIAVVGGGGPEGSGAKGQLHLYLGTADGGFTLSEVMVTGNVPSDVVALDYTGDGTTDAFVTADTNDNQVSLLPQGTAVGQTHGKVTHPFKLAVGDVLGSGTQQVVAFNGGGSADLYKVAETSGGTWQLQRVADVKLPGTQFDGVLADLDDDGALDLLSLSHTRGVVGRALWDGTAYTRVTGKPVTFKNATGIVAADFSNDGQLDLAIATGPADTIEIAYGDGSTFSVKETYGSELGIVSPWSLRTGHLNPTAEGDPPPHDGQLDLVYGSGPRVDILVR